MGKESTCNAGDARDEDSSTGSGRPPGGGGGLPLQHSRLENPVDRGAWWATVHKVTESLTLLKHLVTRAQMHLDIIVQASRPEKDNDSIDF